MSVSDASNERSARENKDEPTRCCQHLAGSDLPSETTDKEALVTISPRPADIDTEAHPDTVRRLQRLLQQSIDDRARLIEVNERLHLQAIHWYVDNGFGYCAACNLPKKNSRHAIKAA